MNESQYEKINDITVQENAVKAVMGPGFINSILILFRNWAWRKHNCKGFKFKLLCNTD